MCRPTNCKRCGNTTWAGCGNHVDQVMANVPKQQQCTCNKAGATTPKRADTKPKRSWFNR